MFGNFIYFIIALLIYTTYQPVSEPQIPALYTFILFIILILVFAFLTRMSFKAIERRIGRTDFNRLDYQYNSAITRYSVIALFIYAIDIYALNIGVWFQQLRLFKLFPTFEALFFLALFIFYLCLVWGVSYEAHIKLYHTDISRRDYIRSNLTFSLPVLLPWFILSISADILTILPFELPKQLLLSSQGQIAYFLVFLVLIAIVGPALIQKFWGCRPLKQGPARYRIELLCQRTQMAYKDIMVWPLFGGRMITAGVMGLVRQFRYILVTPALLRYLEPFEVDAVIAHEIGHIKKKHLLFYLLFFAGYLIFAFSTLDFITYGIIYMEAVYGILGRNTNAYATITSISFSIIMIGIFLIYFRYIFGYFMRNFERQADVYAYSIIGAAIPLITTFEKIAEASGQPADRPNWHHFSLQQRIDYLKKCETDESWVHKQNAKIKKSMLIYILALGLVVWGGFQINFGTAGERINAGFLKTIIEQRIQQQPENPQLHVLLGDLNYNEDNTAKAADAYEKAIQLDPDNARALNNLAWLYATTHTNGLPRPQKALELAKRAARLNPEPHVLDTLAECYFLNGQIDKAIETENRALSLADGDASHYRQQLEKFRAEQSAVHSNDR